MEFLGWRGNKKIFRLCLLIAFLCPAFLTAQPTYHELYRQARAHPGDVKTLAQLASLEKKTGHYRNAVRLYRRCLELTPDKAMYYLRIASLYRELHYPEKAEEVLTAGISSCANKRGLTQSLASVQYRQGKFTQALSTYQSLSRLEPVKPLSSRDKLGIARCLRETERFPEAETIFRELTNTGTDPWVYYEYARLYEKQGKLREAAQIMSQGWELACRRPQWKKEILSQKFAFYRYEYALVLYRNGNHWQALSELRHIVAHPQLRDTPVGEKAQYALERW